MNEKLFNLCATLKELINNDEDVVLLNKLENEINNDDEIIKLAYQKEMKENKYSDLLKIYREDAEECKTAYQELLKAKDDLFSNSKIKEYLAVYSRVRKMYNLINNKIFCLGNE